MAKEKRNLYHRKVEWEHKVKAAENLDAARKNVAIRKAQMKKLNIKKGAYPNLDADLAKKTTEYNKALAKKKRLDRTEKLYDKFNTKLDAYEAKQEANKKAATKARRIKGGVIGAAAMAGHEIGTALNKKYNISGKIVDKLLPSKDPNERANTDIHGKSTRITMTPTT